jgi:hypothetical protein
MGGCRRRNGETTRSQLSLSIAFQTVKGIAIIIWLVAKSTLSRADLLLSASARFRAKLNCVLLRETSVYALTAYPLPKPFDATSLLTASSA